MRLSTADCICISGFWEHCPQAPTGALPLDPAGTSVPRPSVPTLPANPDYATANQLAARLQVACCSLMTEQQVEMTNVHKHLVVTEIDFGSIPEVKQVCSLTFYLLLAKV